MEKLSSVEILTELRAELMNTPRLMKYFEQNSYFGKIL